MSNVNDYQFANMLKIVQSKMIEPQRKKVEDAQNIMDDPMHAWKDAAQKKAGEEQLKAYKAWRDFYESLYNEALKLCTQHENLVNNLAKHYARWYDEVSNEGKQEVEMMSMQADTLNEIFSEIYKELQPLKLEGIKPPAALNLK